MGKKHSTIYMIKKEGIENTVAPVIYVVLIWQKILKSIFRTLWEIGCLFASFLPGASFSIFLVHFLKPLLLRSLFKNRTERHGVSLTWLIKFPIEQISDLSNFRLKIRGFTNTLIPWCLKKSWITYSTYFNDKHEFFKATKFNDNQLSLFFPPKKAV